MSNIRQVWRNSLWFIFGLLIAGNLSGNSFLAKVAAQSTGDTLPGRTTTPQSSVVATFDPTLSPASPNRVWVGRLVSNTLGVTEGQGSIFRVTVQGLPNVPIELWKGSELMVSTSGSKPEVGPFTAEFTPVTQGTWTVTVPAIGASLEVVADNYNLAVIEFAPIAEATPTFTATSLPPSPSPTPTQPAATPTPTPTSTATLIPSPTSLPLPTATPITHWLGAVEARSQLAGTEPGRIIVRVAGIEGLSVRLNDSASVERRCITGRDGVGQDVCVFDDLSPGQYSVAPEGLGVSLPVTLSEHEAVQLGFEVETLPAGVAGWQGRLMQNSGGSQPLPHWASIIRVQVVGRQGQIIALRSVRGIERFCEVAPNPVLGIIACEFGQLGAGVYTVEALNTGADLRLFVDGAGRVDIEFSPTATSESLAARRSPPVVGRGARPDRLATALPTVAPPPTTTPLPVVVVEPSPTPTNVPLPTATPTPAWQGQIIESHFIGGGVIAVRAVGLKDHPVILSSGTWQLAPQLTGSKPELGDYSTEFAGLGPGRYRIELVDLATFEVDLPSGQFILVEFRQGGTNP